MALRLASRLVDLRVKSLLVDLPVKLSAGPSLPEKGTEWAVADEGPAQNNSTEKELPWRLEVRLVNVSVASSSIGNFIRVPSYLTGS